MKKSIWLILALVCASLAAHPCSPLAAQSEAKEKALEAETFVKTVTYLGQDESSLEEAIYEYLKLKHKLTGTKLYHQTDPKNMLLRYEVLAPGAPRTPVYIDTYVAGRNKEDQKITARVVKVFLVHDMAEAVLQPQVRAWIAVLNNQYNLRFWLPSSFAFDSKNKRMIISAYINLPTPGTPLHLEMVVDIVHRMARTWPGYYENLRKVLLRKEPPPDFQAKPAEK